MRETLPEELLGRNNHSQVNFVIEIKQIFWSWSNFFQKSISKSNPDPKISQVSCRISNPVHAHLCHSTVFALLVEINDINKGG